MNTLSRVTLSRDTLSQGIRPLLLSSLLLLLCPGLALAADDLASQPAPAKRVLGGQPYWSVQAGLNHLSHWPAKVDAKAGPVSAALDTGRGTQAGLAIGRQFTANRYEVELQHGSIEIDAARLGSVSGRVDASGSYDALTVNALHQKALGAAVSVYAGVGVGVARTRLPHISLSAGCACIPSADKTGLAWQLKAGAELHISSHGNVFLEAGHLSLPGPQSSTVHYPRRAVTRLGLGYRHLF